MIEHWNYLECREGKNHIERDGKVPASKFSTPGDNDEAFTLIHQGFEPIV